MFDIPADWEEVNFTYLYIDS